jgi:hypothetical protein
MSTDLGSPRSARLSGLARGCSAAGAVALFSLTAFFLFRASHPNSDVCLYARYAKTWSAAGLSELYQTHDVEYPPMAVAVIISVQRFLSGAAVAEPSRANGGSSAAHRNDGPFQSAYRRLQFGTHFLVFLLLLALLEQCCPGETILEKLERVAAFFLASYFLRDFLYNELDLPLCATITTSLLLLLSRRHYAWSYVVLALAIGLKVVPVILVPLWVVASLPPGVLARPWNGRGLLRLAAACLGRLALMMALVAILFLPFYLAGGPRCLAFLTYHARRGIEFESTYAGLLGTLHLAGYPIEVQSAYGSCEIICSMSGLLAQVAPFLVGGLLFAAGCLLLASFIRWASETSHAIDTQTKVGRRFRGEVVNFTLLLLLLFIAANKVFSPQYVLWVLTLAPLVSFRSWARRAFLAGFVALYAATWLICPRYMRAVLEPTPLGTALLVGRSLVLFGLIIGLVFMLIRRFRSLPDAVNADPHERLLLSPKGNTAVLILTSHG